ncbi:hypothetical protein VKT23_013763 [Stygiomarasmius scandens]|uniref:SnoaL-like domain-containing protein n=1 Tax=Marasmiellus scandens TaxID=2682957 RepID=A0ABR1J2I8_9AGAR
MTTTKTLNATASALISAYNAWDLDAILSDSWRSPSCIHQILPLSLGQPAMDNTFYRHYLRTFMSTFRNLTVTVKDTIVDEKQRRVLMWASSKAETDIGPYANEYALILKCDEDGRVVWVGEFLDSQYTIAFFIKLREHMASKSKEDRAGFENNNVL